MAAAGSGAQVPFIFVAEGTYKPSTAGLGNPRDATFPLLNGWTVAGGFAGYGATAPYARDLRQHPSILSGDIGTAGSAADNCYHVVTGSGTNDTAVLDGFTIVGGNANGTTAGNKDRGGGMLNLCGSRAGPIDAGDGRRRGAMLPLPPRKNLKKVIDSYRPRGYDTCA